MIMIKRKLLHFTGLTVPAIYIYFGREMTLSFLIVVLTVFVLLESVRLDVRLREEIKKALKLYVRVEDFERVIEEITKADEKSRIGAHIYFVVGALTVVWFLPDYSIGIITVAVVSDALASLIGRFGRFRYGNKTLEGFLTYLTSATIILGYLHYPYFFVIALIGALVEFLGFPPDDNVNCQIAMGMAVGILKSLPF